MERTLRQGRSDKSVVASLDESKADLAAGRVTDFDDLLDELRVQIESAITQQDAQSIRRTV